RDANILGVRYGPGRQHQPLPGQRLLALRVRPLGPAVEKKAGARRDDRCALCGRLRRRIRASAGRRAIPRRATGSVRALRLGVAPRQDPPDGVWSVRRRASARAGRGEAPDLQLSRLHAQLREDAERSLHGVAADDAHEVAGQAQGAEDGAAAAPARPGPGTRHVSLPGRTRAPPLLRGAAERPGAACLPAGSGKAVVAALAPPQPAVLAASAPDGPLYHPVASARPPLPSLPRCALRRRHSRQEPDAVVPLVRIGGGGRGKPRSLLRPSIRRRWTRVRERPTRAAPHRRSDGAPAPVLRRHGPRVPRAGGPRPQPAQVQAAQARSHSSRTFVTPRNMKRREPIACLLSTCRRKTCGTRAGPNSAAGRRGRRRSAYEAPRAAADGGTRLGGAESKRRRRPRLPAPPSRVTLLLSRTRSPSPHSGAPRRRWLRCSSWTN